MKVSEIFLSIDGEGIRTGCPATFIRLYGCNLNCSYCDTRYACENQAYEELSIDEIMEAVNRFGVPRITLTGGEPLLANDIMELIQRLCEAKYEVNIETNGSVSVEDVATKFDSKHVIITMDWKSPSSGVNSHMLESNLAILCPTDVLKFVVGSEEDLDDMLTVIKSHDIDAQVFVSPVFGKIEPSKIVEYVLQHSQVLKDVRVQVQLHKIIWDPNRRGV